MSFDEVLQRITACFKGVATGDAVGKQTESLKFSEVREWFPEGLRGFHGEIGTIMPRYEGKHYNWRFGETTDDTEQTIAIAKVLARGGTVTHTDIGAMLMNCKKSNRPTLAVGKLQQSGDPSRVCFDADGCGAAMRSTPVGALYSTSNIQSMVSTVFETSIPTHGTRSAICGAAAIAGAVSAAIDGKTPHEVLTHSVLSARVAEKYRPAMDNQSNISTLILNINKDLSRFNTLSLEYIQEKYMPWGVSFIVALAVNFAVITKSAENTILLASNLGGDTDSVASMGAGIAAAMFPDTLNEKWYQSVVEINGNELVELAPMIAKLRT